MSKPFAASELGENLSFVWGSLHSANLGAKYHAREYFGFTCFTRSMQVCRLPAATFVCNVHHLRALDRPQSPLLVHGHGLSSSEPYRKCQVASAPHQSNPTALSKGEKCQPGVVTAQRPTCPHLYNRLHAAATTLPFPQFEDHRGDWQPFSPTLLLQFS